MNFLRGFPISKYWHIILILSISLFLRWILIYQGGQYYFPDEVRYDFSKEIATSILQKDYLKAFADLTVSPGQIVFRALGVIPASAEVYFDLPPVVPAVFFSFFSIANLYLIWKIAKRLEMSERGALVVLLLAASSHSLLYYTRHLLPYDLSLFFGLLAIYVGLSPKPSVSTFFFTGSLVFLCFASYSGYWSLAGFAAVVPVLANPGGQQTFMRRAFFTGIGAIASFFALALVVSLGSGINIFADYKDFAGSISQGNFSEGWSLPLEYLWYSEGLLSIILLAFSGYTAFNYSRENQRVLLIGIGGALFIYLCLFVPSTMLHKFVVYGRLSRQLIPFLILASANGLIFLGNRGKLGHAIATTLMAVVILQGIVNYTASAKVVFPREFLKRAQAEYPAFKMSIKRTNTGAPFICKYRDFVAVNIKYIYPTPETPPNIEKKVLFSEPHPTNFLPYQYEGYSLSERKIFRNENVRMQLIMVEDDAQTFSMFEEMHSCVATVK